MNKNIILSLIFSTVFITGCTQKSTALNHFEKNPKSAYLIQYTKKRDITYNNEIKAMFFATYLNGNYSQYKKDNYENFIIGAYIVNKDEHDFLKEGYTLKINNVVIKDFKKIDKNSQMVKDIPLKNPWSNYYLIKTKSNDENTKLNLKLNHSTFGQAQISFDK